MNKPVFKYSNVWFGASALLSIPLLIDMCTACHLFSLWIAWILFFLICIISIVRLWHAFAQHLYKFAWGLIGQLVLGAGVLIFFQLSYNRVIETPVSNPVTPAVVNIADPLIKKDSIHKEARKDSIKDSDSLKKRVESEKKPSNHIVQPEEKRNKRQSPRYHYKH